MTLTIMIDDQNQIKFKASEPVPIATLMDAFNTVIFDAMKQAVDNAEKENPEHSPQIKEALFDLFNESASNVLAAFAPDKDLRPDITAEAILAEELKLARKKINKTKATKSKHLRSI